MADKLTILSGARDSRAEEVLSHQINIDNYRRAITLAAVDPDLAGFTEQLNNLLASSLVEQKKANIMLTVIQDQLNEMANAAPA